MAKTKAQKARQARKGSNGAKSMPGVSGPGRGLDDNAFAYAKLLADPVSGALTHPVYPGGDSGYLFRAQSLVPLGAGVAQTGGVIKWTPGAMDSSAHEMQFGVTDTNSVALISGLFEAPGRTFLRDNASGYRCVAASARIYYPGTELNRSGRVHFGTCPDGLFTVGANLLVSDVQTVCQNSSRMPDDYVEVIWKPSDGDFMFYNPNSASSALERARMNSIVIAWSGAPVLTGITVEFTAVYEWQPQRGIGIMGATISKNPSANTFDNVIDWLIRNGETFARGVADHAPTAFAIAARGLNPQRRIAYRGGN